MTNHTADVVIVGAGIVGLSVARELQQRYPDLRITLLDKEPTLAKHASGRNSGVLHSGIYYPEGSLKARVCRQGAELMRTYCKERGLPLDECGKIILPVRPGDEAQLDLLYHRGQGNGVPVERIDAQQLKDLEPHTHTLTGSALWVHSTAAYDPKAILVELHRELMAAGVRICLGQPVTSIDPAKATLKAGGYTVQYGHLINTAGLQADHIAQPFGVGRDYTVLPFKGLYYQLDPASGLTFSRHVYPVPDLNMPFLGVHFTKSVSGTIYMGPTAVPAFGRENYRGVQGLDLAETPQILWHLAELYLRNPQGFRQFAHEEGGRYFKTLFAKAAQALVPAIRPEHLLPSEKVGIRPQFLNTQTHSLVMDFLVERGERSTHILNAISPAYTGAFAFAQFVLDNYFEPVNPREPVEHYATQR
jgi:L-2-hydroxyglutarate oxidase LhgO